MTIEMTATYDEVWFEEGEEDPHELGGFTDPHNPWGGFRTELPAAENPGPEWYAENVTTVSFAGVEEAAEFVVDFPGGVWNYSESESGQDVRTGHWLSVTLHVGGDEEAAVFARAEEIEAERAAAYRARYPR